MPSPVRKRRQPATKSSTPLLARNSTVSQWGNSLGFRIPQEAADRLKLTSGTLVRVEVHADSITIRPAARRRKWTETELLKGVTPDAVAGEIDWGGPAGKEVW